jgi:hypothetical protein
MVRMKNLSVVERAILEFLQRSFHKDPRQLKPDFEGLRERLLPYEHDAHERRSFMYLDFVSWLESRIREVPVQQIIRERFLAAQRKMHPGH